MDPDTSITVSRLVDAPAERVFALLADPDRHPDLDASGMVRASRTHLAITEIGEVFVMDMYVEQMGEYTTENHVVVYEEDRAIGWAPASPGERPTGQTFVWRLEEADADATVVTQTLDWSAVENPDLLAMMPVIDRAGLAASLDLLAEALE